MLVYLKFVYPELITVGSQGLHQSFGNLFRTRFSIYVIQLTRIDLKVVKLIITYFLVILQVVGVLQIIEHTVLTSARSQLIAACSLTPRT